MTDSPPRKRAWFQLHLSTCIVLMLAAGALVWANITHVSYEYDGLSKTHGMRLKGWPLGMLVDQEVRFTSNDGNRPIDNRVMKPLGPPEAGSLPDGSFLVRPALLNLFVAIALLLCAAFACEWLIRRRGRAPAP